MNSRCINLQGNVYGRWTVLKFDGVLNRVARWICKCECGIERSVRAQHLKSGSSVSCGCFNREQSSLKHTSHGQCRHEMYKAWTGMKSRCLNRNNTAWHNYGGRGIKVCPEWMDFQRFFDDMGERPKGMTLERVDNDGDYNQSNCKWASRKEQNENHRRNRLIEFQGESMLLRDWAKKIGIKQNTLILRLQKWPIDRALTEPCNKEYRRNT